MGAVVAAVALKALAGGTLVVVFAMISDIVRPRSISGVFGSAPSIALASLSVTVIAEGLKAADAASFGMIAGSLGMLAYCVACRPAVQRHGGLVGSLISLPAWVAAAALLALALLR